VIVIETKNGSKVKGRSICLQHTSVFVDRRFSIINFPNQFGQGIQSSFAYVDGIGWGRVK